MCVNAVRDCMLNNVNIIPAVLYINYLRVAKHVCLPEIHRSIFARLFQIYLVRLITKSSDMIFDLSYQI